MTPQQIRFWLSIIEGKHRHIATLERWIDHDTHLIAITNSPYRQQNYIRERAKLATQLERAEMNLADNLTYWEAVKP